MSGRIVEHYLNITYDTYLTLPYGNKVLGIITIDHSDHNTYGASSHRLLILTNNSNSPGGTYNIQIIPYISWSEVPDGYKYLQSVKTTYSVGADSSLLVPAPTHHHFFYKITPEPGPAIEVDVPFNRLSHIE